MLWAWSRLHIPTTSRVTGELAGPQTYLSMKSRLGLCSSSPG